jgi:hypothetical protein
MQGIKGIREEKTRILQDVRMIRMGEEIFLCLCSYPVDPVHTVQMEEYTVYLFLCAASQSDKIHRWTIAS